MTTRILVIGAGSVGRRHLRNLKALGCTVSAYDPRKDRLGEAARDVPDVRAYHDLDEALDDAHDGAFVCSPPRFHVEQALDCVDRRLPVFLEKPPSIDLASTERLAERVRATGVPLLLGYTYRWWGPLRRARECVLGGEIGRVRHVRFLMSAHLADWHPWERYQDFFMASRELGGGALLDESHFIDLMLWFFGVPRHAFARVERVGGLEIDTDDTVDAWFGYDDGKRVTMHLDLLGRPHEKEVTFVGDEGTLRWTFDPNRVRVGKGAAQAWSDETFVGDRNDMFVAAAREFLDVVAGARPSCGVADAVEAMRTIEAMRKSHATGRVVEV